MTSPSSVNLNPTDLRQRYLQVLHSLIGGAPIHLYLADLPHLAQANLDCWCPADLFDKPESEGVLCVEQLKTPLGVVPKARIRESDVIAVDATSKAIRSL